MARVTTPSGITLEFDGPEDLTWGEAKEIARRMSSATPDDVEYALGVMIKSWSGPLVEGKQPPAVGSAPNGETAVYPNGLLSLKMRHVNEIAEVIMAASTAEGKATETGI